MCWIKTSKIWSFETESIILLRNRRFNVNSLAAGAT
jgi:hypothetical protein